MSLDGVEYWRRRALAAEMLIRGCQAILAVSELGHPEVDKAMRLAAYAKHTSSCQLVTSGRMDVPCTCGLDEALR